MGVIARQSAKYSFVGYFSVLIGIFAALFVYPYNLEFAGKLQFIYATALLILPCVAIGFPYANVRFFSMVSKSNNQHNLLLFTMFSLTLNFIFITLVYFVLGAFFTEIQKTDLWEMKIYVFPILFFLSFTQLVSKYISIKKRIVIPNIFENIFPKIGIISAVYGYVFLQFSEEVCTFIFILFYAFAWLGMLIYLQKLDPIPSKFSIAFLNKNNFKKELFTYSFYTFLGSMGTIIALNIDIYMIGEFLGYSEITIYNTSFNLVRMITVPALGIYTISSPIIADYVENNKIKELQELHQKTSLYLFAVGIIFFGLIVASIDDLFLLMKNGEVLAKGKNVIYIMGFALLFDLATGFNGYIIANSKYYKFNNITTVVLAFLTILTNSFFLFYLKIGLIGVALATAFSMTVYNSIKIWFNYKKFGVHPFSVKLLYLLGLLILVLVINSFLPSFKNSFVNLCYKPLVAGTIFFIVNQIFKIIPLAEIIPKNIKKLFF